MNNNTFPTEEIERIITNFAVSPQNMFRTIFYSFYLYLKSVTFDVAILCALILQYVYRNKVTLNNNKFYYRREIMNNHKFYYRRERMNNNIFTTDEREWIITHSLQMRENE